MLGVEIISPYPQGENKMKKITGFLVLMGTVATLSACSNGLPTCYDELNECGRDTAYTEERTVKANRKKAPAPEPVPAPVVAPAPAPEPAPAPAPVVVDAPVMRSAEPMIQHIAK